MSDRATSPKLARSDAVLRVVAEIGPWATGPGPLYRQLARALAGAIERGALAGGARLPAERVLADTLPVSRGTAVAAYDMLVADRLVERRRGSGTFVAAGVGPALPADQEGPALVHRLVDRSTGERPLLDLSLSVIADAGGLPDVAVTTADLATVVPPTGLSPWGLPALRELLAAHVSGWGLPTRAGQIVVTAGAQQAVSLAAACWVRAGDTVVVDDPTYPGAIAAFRQAGARLIGVPLDRYGPRPDLLEAALRHHPALVYLQSGVHSPTGSVLGRRRAEELAACLARARVPFVEDRALGDLAWTPTAEPIAGMLPATSSVVVGSLSKLFWGGLRIGFVRAEEPLALRFARIKATRDLGTSAVGQLLAARLLPHAAGVAAGRVAELESRAAVLQAALADALPGARWEPPAGGMSLWVRLPARTAAGLAATAGRLGVAVATAESLSPGSGMDVAADYGTSATGAHADRLRLSFSLPVADLQTAAARLGEAWAASHPIARR